MQLIAITMLVATLTVKQTDTTGKRVEAFRVFATEYFDRVKKRDTVFLKAHTIFPIRNSSFNLLDGSLEGKAITSGMFLKRLKKLFPAEYMADIKKIGQFSASQRTEEYYIECAYNRGGLDSNVTWYFIKKNGQFYFKTYRAEAG